MKLTRLITATLCTGTLLAAAAPLSAHGIWFAQRARQLALIYGVGADDLDAVKHLPVIKAVTGYDADWAPVSTRLREAGVIPVVDDDEPVAAVAAVKQAVPRPRNLVPPEPARQMAGARRSLRRVPEPGARR